MPVSLVFKDSLMFIFEMQLWIRNNDTFVFPSKRLYRGFLSKQIYKAKGIIICPASSPLFSFDRGWASDRYA